MSEPLEASNGLAVRRAAAYIRMSTERQVYSTANQMERLRDYAAEHQITIVAVYEDAGKSGLTLRGRPGIQQLLADVQTRNDFTCILVYDVSRWGRFQDVDESAHYEYICRMNGVQVTYCTEAFENDGSPYTSIIKALKRIAAADYSRELSSKVFAAQCRIIRMGYKMGGQAGYGLRRALLESNGEFIRIMSRGEWKAVQTHRVVLIPGPKDEIDIVNQIFTWYVEDGAGDRRIATLLNQQGVASESGRPWTGEVIRGILRNEKYIGNLVFNKESFKLRKAAVKNPPAQWVRCDGAFPPVVPIALFHAALAKRSERSLRSTTGALLEILQRIYRTHGSISTDLIDQDPEAPTAQLFSRRFGNLYAAYTLAGIPGQHEAGLLAVRKRTLALRATVVAAVQQCTTDAGGTWQAMASAHTLCINGHVSVSIRIVRCAVDNVQGDHRWRINKRLATGYDFLLAALLDDRNGAVEAYMLLPTQEFRSRDMSFTEHSRANFSQFIRTDLADFFLPAPLPSNMVLMSRSGRKLLASAGPGGG